MISAAIIGAAGGNKRKPPVHVQEMIAEALRTNTDPIGRPLPFLSSWNTGYVAWANQDGSAYTYCDLAWQVDQIKAGHRWLPVVRWPADIATTGNRYGYYGEAFDTLALWGLPFVFEELQHEARLIQDATLAAYPYATDETHPNANGAWYKLSVKQSGVDFMGDNLGTWNEAGYLATTEKDSWDDLMARYPNPRLLIFLSNNEQAAVSDANIDNSDRYLEVYSAGAASDLKRQRKREGYAERYPQLFAGMDSGLESWNPGIAWKNAAKHIGYNVGLIGWYFRYSGWHVDSGYYSASGEPTVDYAYWDGGSPEYYLNDWEAIFDFQVYSPQVQWMNVKWLLDDFIYPANPAFWHEMSIWDGYDPNTGGKRQDYLDISDPFLPDRYGAYARYGMWLTRPRVVREFRGGNQTQEDIGPEYLQALMQAVDEVWTDATLKRFWREGANVKNTAATHPYTSFSPATEYSTAERWWMLTTDLDPARPWTLTTELPVFALALVIGTTPNREWLVYAYSPKQDRTSVTITIPGYGNVTIDVPQAGVFHYVAEA